MTNTQSRPRPGPKAVCPICKKPTVRKYRPFCSKRCSDLDLGHWLNGTYAIPDHGPVPADIAVDGNRDGDDDEPA